MVDKVDANGGVLVENAEKARMGRSEGATRSFCVPGLSGSDGMYGSCGSDGADERTASDAERETSGITCSLEDDLDKKGCGLEGDARDDAEVGHHLCDLLRQKGEAVAYLMSASLAPYAWCFVQARTPEVMATFFGSVPQ